MSEKHNRNNFETFKASFCIGKVAYYKITFGSHVFKSILSKMNKLPSMSNTGPQWPSG